MTYTATAKQGTTWRVYFMRYTSDVRHLGYTIIKQHLFSTKSGAVSGHLPPGQYSAVAVFHTPQNWWVCPTVQEKDLPRPGVIAELCFGKHLKQCQADVKILPDAPESASGEAH